MDIPGIEVIATVLFVSVGWVMVRHAARTIRQKRRHFLDYYPFPSTISKKVKARYPHLTEEDLQRVTHALREYFQICRLAGNRMIAMPSQVVDIAWHEFILFTRTYQEFCRKGLGRFLHHTPAEAMSTPTQAQDGIRRAWRLSCLRAKIDGKKPDRLPILFAIDMDLAIPDGFKYLLSCKQGGQGYCASHIGCTSGRRTRGGCGGGCGGGCSGGTYNEWGDGGIGDGCGGGGCGGGCGGGGD
jgi:hypothetical protein